MTFCGSQHILYTMKEVWREKLQKYIEEEGRKKIAVARQLGVSRATLSSWLAGRSYPRPKHIQRIVTTIPSIEFSDFGILILQTDEDEIVDVIKILLDNLHLLNNGVKEKLIQSIRESIRVNSGSSMVDIVKNALQSVNSKGAFAQPQAYNRGKGITKKEVHNEVGS